MASNENASPTNQKPTMHANTPSRRVLGDVSPNVNMASPVPAFLRKPLTSSPLKRSFTAAVENGDGLKYLKRRKLTDEEVLSEVHEQGVQPDPSSSHRFGDPLRPVLGSPELESYAKEHSASPSFQELSPTEPNTPSESDDSSQESSAERNSFSSLINYDPSSQTSHFGTISNAQMLKLYLRVAMYKVRTNQIDVPFSQLHVERRPRKPSTREAVEEAVAQLRKEAQEANLRHQAPIPKLLDGPVLLPTAYSSRMLYHGHPPSSPPAFRSPERLPTGPSVSTPQRQLWKVENPPGSGELTSSAVKGRAAAHLLGLRNAT